MYIRPVSRPVAIITISQNEFFQYYKNSWTKNMSMKSCVLTQSKPVLTVTSCQRSPLSSGHVVTPLTNFLLFYHFIKRSPFIRGQRSAKLTPEHYLLAVLAAIVLFSSYFFKHCWLIFKKNRINTGRLSDIFIQ